MAVVFLLSFGGTAAFLFLAFSEAGFFFFDVCCFSLCVLGAAFFLETLFFAGAADSLFLSGEECFAFLSTSWTSDLVFFLPSLVFVLTFLVDSLLGATTPSTSCNASLFVRFPSLVFFALAAAAAAFFF